MSENTMTPNASEPKVYRVPSTNLGVLKDKFAKMARRAKKLGLPAPTFREVQEPTRIQKKDEITGLVTKTYLLHHIVVDPGCTEVKVDGWKFVAVVQHTEEGNVIRNISGEEIPAQYRNTTNYCDHCKVKRERKDTYILRKDE